MVESTSDDGGSDSGGDSSTGPLRDFLTSPIGLAAVGGILATVVVGYMVF